MNYSLAPHLGAMLGSPSQVGIPPDIHQFVLMDVSQVEGLDKRWPRLCQQAPHSLLFEDTPARNALALSPVLLQLPDTPAQALEQCLALNAACHSKPVLSVLLSTLSLPALTEHLRRLLFIESDGTPYLWRFADTQMLQATVPALRPAQRQWVVGPCQAWWAADHEGRLLDFAAQSDPASPLLDEPALHLDADQERLMMQGVAAPVLASQIRAMSPDFAQQLSHAQQTAFAIYCLHQAQAQGLSEDDELLPWALDRWSHQCLAS